MEFRMQFDMDNAAFEDDPAAEVQRILRDVGDQIASFEVSISIGVESGYPIRDANGNQIGKWSVK